MICLTDQRPVKDVLRRLAGDLQLAAATALMAFVGVRLGRVLDMSHFVAMIYLGRIVEAATAEKLERPSSPILASTHRRGAACSVS